MSNSLELTLIEVNLSGIKIEVLNRLSSSILSKNIIKVKKLNQNSLNFIDADYEIKDATTKDAIIVATNSEGLEMDFSEEDLLLIQIIDTDLKTSDRISLDFKEQYQSENKATTKYEMPEEPGNYKLNLLSINDIDLNGQIETEEFTLCNPPGDDSRIIVNKNYLTRFAGQLCLVTNELTDVLPNGNYQVIFSAKKQ